MADNYNSDSEPTTRTLLRRVLDTADSRTPRRLRSAGAGYGKATQLEEPRSRVWVGANANPIWRGQQSQREVELRALRIGPLP